MKVDSEKIKKAKGRTYINVEDCPIPICVDDYLEYKKIEEELGIDLVTLFQALKNGAIYTNKGKISLVSLALVYSMSKKRWMFLDIDSISLAHTCFSIKDKNLDLKIFKEKLTND